MTTAINANIGIMADSHGRPQTIIDALIFFKERGCEALYHLGDICDSAHPETADHCVGLLRENNILGIKGNNDHQVIVNHQGRQNAHPASKTIEYLEHLPMTVERGDALMAHSLPFVKERGLSCMVGVLGPDEAALFFQTYPHKMLLRGHSHYPKILRLRKHTLASEKILPGDTIQMVGETPCIVTCGALDQGFLMIWNPGKQTIACHMMS